MNGTYLSLFSGIGGLDLAVEAHGYRCVGQVEYEPACASVLERWWPDVPRWGDVHGFSAAAYADEWRRGIHGESNGGTQRPGLEASRRGDADGLGPDLIIGGYPCQPFSHAGKRGGTDDPRHLWPEFARLIGEFRPRLALLENVPGHLSLGAAEVLADLASLGYDATWTTLRASDVGASHRRERWFCLAHDTERITRPASRGQDDQGGPTAAPERGRDSSARDTDRLTGEGGTGSEGSQPEPSGDRRLERTNADRERRGLVREGTLAAGDHGESQSRAGGLGQDASDPSGEGLEGDRHGGPASDFAWGAYEGAIRRWERVMGPAPHPVDDRNRLAPSFVTWMMGFAQGWTEGMTRTQALKALGNAVVPQQAVAAVSLLQGETV